MEGSMASFYILTLTLTQKLKRRAVASREWRIRYKTARREAVVAPVAFRYLTN